MRIHSTPVEHKFTEYENMIIQFYLFFFFNLTLHILDVLPQDLAKSPNQDIRIKTSKVALKFKRHIDSSAAEMPYKFQSDTIIITSNLAATRLHEILQ